MRWSASAALLGAFVFSARACETCESPGRDVVQTRHVRRMQPDAQNATSSPRGPLAWGQLNFLHTTDTHGWLEGHLKEKNYGADWGDFASFVKGMRRKADELDVDLLVVDTGDLHDGAGLSDATAPNGAISNPIFENIDYDLLTIGNHELYISDIAYETFNQFSKHYGDRYLTSNVQIYNPASKAYEYVGKTHRYFTTDHGLRIMAYGVLFNFGGNSNASKIIKAKDMVNQTWFQHTLKDKRPVDLYLVIGHNPVSTADSGSTFSYVFNAIRAAKPDTPIQIFGGHSHVRDFAVYDDKSTALSSGRYCETLGWLSIGGLNGDEWSGCEESLGPDGVPNPTRKAVKAKSNSTTTGSVPLASSNSSSDLTYSRRYLDWNRRTFEYHAADSQSDSFDTRKGLRITKNITDSRKALNLSKLYGCAPQTWCAACVPFESNGSVFTLLEKALRPTVINPARSNNSRIIVLNTGSVRFDLVKGPFTYDDSFIVSPFNNTFQYVADVPNAYASKILSGLNNGGFKGRRSLETKDFGFYSPSLNVRDSCADPVLKVEGMHKRSLGVVRRQSVVTPGYTTTDDFGTDGDDTVHSPIPSYKVPKYFASNANFPTDGTNPTKVDLIFLDYIAPDVITLLQSLGGNYDTASVAQYLPASVNSNTYLPAYAKLAPDWQANVPNCPVGTGVGSTN